MPTRDGKPTFDERLIEVGMDAALAGDLDGAKEALQMAQEIQEAAKKDKEQREKSD